MANNFILKKQPEFYEYISPIQHNLIKVLDNVGPLTRKQLVKHLNTPRTTIYDNLVKLQKRKLIEKYSRNDGKRGRPVVFWRLNNKK